MTDTVGAQSSAVPAPQSLPARAIGVLTSPRATYAGVAARPRWFGALALVIVVSMACSTAFLSTDIGKDALLDQQTRQAESFSGHPMTDAQYAQMQKVLPYSPYFAAGSQLVALPLMALLIAGISFAVFTAMLGGDGTFKQTFAVVVHSGMVLTVCAAVHDAAELRAGNDVERDEPRRLRAVPRRGVVRGARSSGRSICSSCGGRSAWPLDWVFSTRSARARSRPASSSCTWRSA